MISKDFKQRLSGLVDQLDNDIIKVWELEYEELQQTQNIDHVAHSPSAKRSTFQNDQFKFLFTMSHELLYILQKTLKDVDPNKTVTFRHPNAVDNEDQKKKVDRKRPLSPNSPNEKSQQNHIPVDQQPLTHTDAGFSSIAHYQNFQSFLISYIKFTIEQTLILILVTTVEENTENLKVHQDRLRKSSFATGVRVEKIICALMRLFPSIRDFSSASIFDKNFLLNTIFNASQLSEHEAVAEKQTLTPYQISTRQLLSEGGINQKTVKQIIEVQREIKDSLEQRLNTLISNLKIDAVFLVQHPALLKIARRCKFDHEIDGDMFRQAFESEFGFDILTETRWQQFLSFNPNYTKTGKIQLIDAINMTDYLNFREVVSVFDKDFIGPTLKMVAIETNEDKTELLKNDKKEEEDSRVLKTVFIRTKLDFKTNFNAVFILHLFGMQTIHQDSKKIIQLSSGTKKNTKIEGTPDDIQEKLNFQGEQVNLELQIPKPEDQLSTEQLTDPDQPQSPKGPQSPQSLKSHQTLQSPESNKEAQPVKQKTTKTKEQIAYEQDLARRWKTYDKTLKMIVPYNLQDEGFFVTFASPAEAIALVQSLNLNKLLYQITTDEGKNSKITLPYFVSSQLLNQKIGLSLMQKLYDLPQSTDFLQIKKIIRNAYLFTNFSQTEHDLCTQQIKIRWMLYNKHYKLFMKIIAISIDGFKTDRYLTKIKDMNEKIDLATQQLLDEEKVIEKGNLQPEVLNLTIERISSFLLKVETYKQEKALLTEKLEKKGQKWQSIDLKFKTRKQSLWDLMHVGIITLTEICKHQEAENDFGIQICQHEMAILKIDEIFIQNRNRSVHFRGEVEYQIQQKKDTLNDLGQTQIELESKIQFIVEEQLEMRKQRAEMLLLQEMKMKKELLAEELQLQEGRIQHLRKVLGYSRHAQD